MAKRIDPLKAKQAKQKKIAIAGGVILLALLGIQGPKTLKMLKGPQPVASAASTTPAAPSTPTPIAPVDGTDTTASAPTGGVELAAVADSDQPPVIEQGQLATFERFSSKDPFAQQAEPVEPAASGASAEEDADKDPDAGKDGEGKTGSDAGADSGSGADADSDGETDGGFTAGGGTAAAPEPATATSISVNGVAEDVVVEGAFPKDEPTFVLASIAKDGKSVEIGIAGGEYATGGETMKLTFGKKITLQNTADGSRYEIELISIAGFVVPKPKK
jgi:hypothetical protein